MTVTRSAQSAVKDSRLAQLPLIQQGDNLLIDARLLHSQLKVGRDFTNWIKYRIEEYGFEPGRDFFSAIDSPKLANQKGRGGDRRSIQIHLTLDMAKELAMVERNEVGRAIRRYFIQKEKEARGISHLPAEGKLFAGLKPKHFNDRKMYPYKEVLARCGYSIKAGTSQRKARYWMHFIKDGHLLYITEAFARHLFHQRQVLNNRAVMLASQPVLPLGFGEKGGLLA